MSNEENSEAIQRLEDAFPQSDLKQRPGGGGKMLDYIDWPKAVRRLNEAVGTDNWDFDVSDLQFRGDLITGSVICKGSLTIRFPDGSASTKAQYGGNAYGQLANGRQGLSAEDAAKAAGSDAVKKCAALFGIALDLSEGGDNGGNFGGGYTQPQGGNNGYNAPPANNGGGFTPRQDNAPMPSNQGGDQGGGALTCEDCGEYLTPTNFKDGSTWSPEQLASFGRRKHGRVLNMDCYRKANEAKRRAEQSLEQIPF